jgi:DNA-binding GntR family transcriptional regulator
MKATPKPDHGASSRQYAMQAASRVRSPTLASIVQQKIIGDISRGVLPPGMRLEEVDIAARYRVSRTPVREALRQLAALGIVDIRLRQGVVVAERSLDHFANLLEVIADLEASCARYAAMRMTEQERGALSDLHEDSGQAVARHDAVQFDRANRIFHKVIHDGAHNAVLSSSIEQMRLRTLPYTRAEFVSEQRRMETSHIEHYAIVQAILRRESEASYHIMRLHVLDAGHAVEDLPPQDAALND